MCATPDTTDSPDSRDWRVLKGKRLKYLSWCNGRRARRPTAQHNPVRPTQRGVRSGSSVAAASH